VTQRSSSTSTSQQLAILGGTPALPAGPPPWPPADDDVRQALAACYQNGSWGRYLGPNCDRLADRLTAVCQRSLCRLCSSGTVAVELALRGLQAGPGDEVILAAYDFAGNFRAVEAVGARPVLVDIEPATWTLTAESIRQAHTPQVKAVIVSHLHGGLAPMEEICQAAADLGISVIEDACQASGARVAGRPAGAWGDVSVLSFGGSKLLTAGRGGALLTDRPEVLQRVQIYARPGNDAYPLSELQAAVLLPQLEKLPERHNRRAENVRRLRAAIDDIKTLTPVRLSESPRDSAAFYKHAWLYVRENGHPDRGRLIQALQAEGVAIDAGFRGFASRPESRCRKVGPLSAARRAAESTLLLHHPVLLSEAEVIDQVARAIGKVFQNLAMLSDGGASRVQSTDSRQ